MALTGCTASSPSTCTLTVESQVPVTFHGNEPVIDVTIAGHVLHMLLDTGAQVSVLSPAAAKSLPGTAFVRYSEQLSGVNGEVDSNLVSTPNLQIGTLTVTNDTFLIADSLGFDGVIGLNILDKLNLALDFPDNQILLIKRGDCATGTPWSGEFSQIPFTSGIQEKFVNVQIDGKTVTLKFDTGAVTTVLTQNALTRSGIQPDSIGKTHGDMAFGNLKGHSTTETFSTVEVSDLTYPSVPLKVIDKYNAFPDYDGLLGEDFLRLKKIYINNDTSTIWIQDASN